MIYVTLDTDSWLNLTHDVNQQDETQIGPFDDLLFWLEQGHVKLVLPHNIKSEWERNKETNIRKAKDILFHSFQQGREYFKNHPHISTFYHPTSFESLVRQKVARIDKIFERAELAPTTDETIRIAATHTLGLIAPNHKKESFRDTINIQSLIGYLKEKGYTSCYFVTDNHSDYSDPNVKDRIHADLEAAFREANLQFVYSSRKLIYGHLKNKLPTYADFLAEERRSKEEEELRMRQQEEASSRESASREFLENAWYIDRILAKRSRTNFDEKVLMELIASHPSYNTYFLKKVGDGGLV